MLRPIIPSTFLKQTQSNPKTSLNNHSFLRDVPVPDLAAVQTAEIRGLPPMWECLG